MRRPILAIMAIVALAMAGIAAAVIVMQPASPAVIGGHPLLEAAAPEIALDDVDGRAVRLSDYRGRPVIVNFWAPWCVPCREEFPILKDARDRYADEGLEILGVVFEDDPEAAREYMARAGADWPALVDPDEAVAAAYFVNGPPMSFFIDGEGVVRSIAYGPPPSGTLDDRIADILPESAPTPSSKAP